MEKSFFGYIYRLTTCQADMLHDLLEEYLIKPGNNYDDVCLKILDEIRIHILEKECTKELPVFLKYQSYSYNPGIHEVWKVNKNFDKIIYLGFRPIREIDVINYVDYPAFLTIPELEVIYKKYNDFFTQKAIDKIKK